jgi:hypothetical protein
MIKTAIKFGAPMYIYILDPEFYNRISHITILYAKTKKKNY